MEATTKSDDGGGPTGSSGINGSLVDVRPLSGALHAHAIRIGPDEALVPSLLQAAKMAAQNSPSSASAFVMTAVGSIYDVTLRMAATSDDSRSPLETKHWKGHFEVVSLVGTFSPLDDAKHLHISISNCKGEAFGGHLVAAKVHTTLELVLGTVENVAFRRQMDAETGFRELVVKRHTENAIN